MDLPILSIQDLTHDGMGLGRLEGQVILVAGALPGDRVQVRVVHQARRHAVGQLVALLDPSPDRRRPPCILADHCGGCTLQALEDPAEARWKQRSVTETLLRVGGYGGEVRPILTAPAGLGYRNRAIIPLERDPHGKLRAGFYRKGSHRIVNMNRCPVLDPRLDAMVAPLKAELDRSGWPMDHHSAAGSPGGGLRHLALRIGRNSGERLLTLIASHGQLPGLERLAGQWMERWPEVVGVTLNIQGDPGNRLFGPHNHTVQGRPWLKETFAGVELQIGADTFFQVHTGQAERVVGLLLEALGPPGGLILEGYCGIGTFSLPLARAGWRVMGIEQQLEAVALARANGQRNGLMDRCLFQVGDVAELLDQALGQHHPGAVLLDPPRKGLQEPVLRSLLQQLPPRILYLSCDPATLARDLGRLTREGDYGIASVQPLDFFPNTSHVEVLAVLEHPGQSFA